MYIDIHAHTSAHPLRNLHVNDASIPSLLERAGKETALTLLIATYFPLKGSGIPNREMLRRIGNDPRLAMIGSLDASGDIAAGVAELRELAKTGQIVGIKLFPGYQLIGVDDPKLTPVYELAVEYRLPITIHGGELHGCHSYAERQKQSCPACDRLDTLQHLAHPQALESTIAAWPKVTFVIAHLANPYFAELRQLMRRYLNVVTDFSGQFVSGGYEDAPEYRQEIVNELRQFLALPNGEQRLLFGTDFPIQSHADSVWLLKQLHLDPHIESLIAWRNALEVYPRLNQILCRQIGAGDD